MTYKVIAWINKDPLSARDSATNLYGSRREIDFGVRPILSICNAITEVEESVLDLIVIDTYANLGENCSDQKIMKIISKVKKQGKTKPEDHIRSSLRLIEIIRGEDSANKKTPVIVTSNYENEKESYLKAGTNHYLLSEKNSRDNLINIAVRELKI